MTAETDNARTIRGVELKSLQSIVDMAGAKGVLLGLIWDRGDYFTVDFACHKMDATAARMIAGQIIVSLAADERLPADDRENLVQAFNLLGLKRPESDDRSDDGE